ncbi:MAG: adenylosuccinate synthase [Anaerolineales bacterium]|nr:adenylosuccinate synthase [Anaerolineales bacterium]
MPLDLVVGAQWGDEGKGRIIDLLAASADLVARWGGGDNAGHTVTVGQRVFRLHLVPSGILQPHTLCLLGAGMVIHPGRLVGELRQLESAGIDVSPNRLKLSTAAHIITPAHLALDAAQESSRGQAELGTTRRGTGPAYADKASRRGLRAGAMRQPEDFARKVTEAVTAAAPSLPAQAADQNLDPEAVGREYGEYAEVLRPFLADSGRLAAEALALGKVVLGEGAQGTLLDLDHGTYPFVTSSCTTTAGALAGLGVGPGHLRHVLGVAKVFQTRVGAGPFPTEIQGPTADRLRGTGDQPWDEFGTTTARPRRIGWLDAVLLRYAIRINGLTEIALTKLDILNGLDPLMMCTAYLGEGGASGDLDSGLDELEQVSPSYLSLAGWQADLRQARSWDDLPDAARDYVQEIERQIGLPVRLISVGPERKQIIARGDR